MRLFLAPMEGLADAVMRDVLTRLGGIDLCVAEFVRVTHHLLSERVLLRTVPELANGGCTPAGVPVRLQLLGSDPVCLAENAAQAAELGAPGIDLNFGCPAPTVNRHGGGAVLLAEPERIHAIVAAARRAVPEGVPVTVKPASTVSVGSTLLTVRSNVALLSPPSSSVAVIVTVVVAKSSAPS